MPQVSVQEKASHNKSSRHKQTEHFENVEEWPINPKPIQQSIINRWIHISGAPPPMVLHERCFQDLRILIEPEQSD